MSFYKKLKLKIKNKSATVAIIGLGYVGLPLSVEIAKKGFKVVGYDNNIEKIEMLKKKKSYIQTIDQSFLKSKKYENFLPTSDVNDLVSIDIFIICVPTPLDKNLSPDLSYLISARNVIDNVLNKGSLIILESTTYPGCTDEMYAEYFSTDYKIGSEVFIGYSPEREDPGNHDFKTNNMAKIISGSSKSCLEVIKDFYSLFIKNVVSVSSTRTAEMSKLLENIYRSVNIGLVNEMKIMSEKFNVDIFEVIKAASTKPFGFKPFFPGPGLGGHCIPVDPFYLSWKVKEHGHHAKFIEISGEINREMPSHIVEKSVEVLNEKKKSISRSKILIMGVAYKKDIDDVRETPALGIIEMLKSLGGEVIYHDPHITEFHCSYGKMKSKKITKKLLNSVDLVIIVTDHTQINYKLIKSNSKCILDTRGVYEILPNKIYRG